MSALENTVFVVDRRADMPAVRDQGSRPICTAMASTSAHSFIRGNDTILSPEYLHYHATMGKPGFGASFPGLQRALVGDGQCAESDCPLQSFDPDPSWSPPSGLVVFKRLSNIKPGTSAELVRLLDAGGAPVAGCSIGTSFVSADGTSVVGANLPALAMHALVVVGYGTLGGDRVFLIRNSWGPAWAAQGHVLVDESFVRENVHELLQPSGEP